MIYEELGELSKAIGFFQRAIEEDMFRPEAHINLGRALYHYDYAQLNAKKLQRIATRLQMGLSMDPENQEARNLLNEIKNLQDALSPTYVRRPASVGRTTHSASHRPYARRPH